MEQFLKLPPAQKAAVLAAILAVLGVGMYFLLVDPELARADQSRSSLSGLEKQIADLGDVGADEQERLRKVKDDLVEIDKENRKMLPAAEEIPDFIDSVQADARAVGLEVRRFERLPAESQDLYNAIPIRMVVEGTMLELVEFLRTYARPDRRVVNVRDLAIERLPSDVNDLRKQLLASKPLEAEREKTGATLARTPEELLLEQIELLELARKNSKIRANFTAFAFTWTGKPAENVEGAPTAKKGKKKRT